MIDEQTNEESNEQTSSPPSRLADWYNMFAEPFAYNELLWQMLLRDLRVRYKQAVMGVFWAVFSPLMVVISGCVIKYVMATIGGQGLEAEPFANMSVKAIAWSFFMGIVGGSAGCLLGNIGLITKIYFPREVLPMAVICTQCFDSGIGAGVLFIFLACIGSVTWSLNLLWLPVLILLIAMLALAIGMIVSSAMVFYRDVKYLFSVFTGFGIFYTPIFFESNQLGPTLSWVMMLNPVAPLMEATRLVVVQGHNLFVPWYDANQAIVWHPGFLLYSAVFAIVGLIFSWRYFHKMEKQYAEFI